MFGHVGSPHHFSVMLDASALVPGYTCSNYPEEELSTVRMGEENLPGLRMLQWNVLSHALNFGLLAYLLKFIIGLSRITMTSLLYPR